MDIDKVLAGLPDDEPVPQTPRNTGFVAMDDAFAASDFGIQEAETFTKSDDDADTVLMHLPNKKVARVTKRRLQSCRTSQELRELDRSLYLSVGLNPADFGI